MSIKVLYLPINFYTSRNEFLATPLSNCCPITDVAAAPHTKCCPKSDDVCTYQRPNGTSFKLVHLATALVLICLRCLNCTEFGQLILRKIVNTVATRCHILRLTIVHQIRFRPREISFSSGNVYKMVENCTLQTSRRLRRLRFSGADVVLLINDHIIISSSSSISSIIITLDAENRGSKKSKPDCSDRGSGMRARPTHGQRLQPVSALRSAIPQIDTSQ